MPTVVICVNGENFSINEAIFHLLLENTPASSLKGYRRAIEGEAIQLDELIHLSRKACIPYSLFFAPLPFVRDQIAIKDKKLLEGTGKKNFSINTRDSIKISQIQLIIIDLIRKQELLKRMKPELENNHFIGSLKRKGKSIESDAARFKKLLKLSDSTLRDIRTKESAVQTLKNHLEEQQVFVSESSNNYMPQLLHDIDFCGITIKDNKIPFIFLASERTNFIDVPSGRKLFTLTLLAVLIARGIFAPVTTDKQTISAKQSWEYALVGEILMPKYDFVTCDFSSLKAIKVTAERYKVTPRAVIIRCVHLNLLDFETAQSYTSILEEEWSHIPQNDWFRPPKPVNAIKKYTGIKYSQLMMDAYEAGKISGKNFCREVCLNKIGPRDLDSFKEAIQ